MNRIALGLVLAAISLPQLGFSQDDAAKTDLMAAIGRLSQRDVTLVGSIDEEAQEQPVGAGNGGMQRVVVSSMSSGVGTEYRGDVEVMASKSGELVIASKEELPGLKVYKAGDEVLNIQAHMQEPFSTVKLVGSVAKLVDWNALRNAVESASKIRTTAKGKETEYRLVLDAEFIPQEAMPMPPGLGAVVGPNLVAGRANVRIQAANPMTPSVVELAATFTMNADKEITGLEYAVQYDDPMKAVMAQAIKGGAAVIQFGPKPVKPIGEADLGKLIVYDFDVVAKPSVKVTEFMIQAKAMLKNRK